MITNKNLIVRSMSCLGSTVIFSMLLVSTTQAATVSGGALTLNLNRVALIDGTLLDNTPAPSIYLEEFWDASAASKTFLQLRDENTPVNLTDYAANEISAEGLQFAVNGASIPANPGGRQNRNTTFDFDPNNLFGTATGSIGLGGVMRFRVDVNPPNNRVLLGDMTLEYDPASEGASAGRSGWIITNHIGFDAGGFELFDVTTLLVGNSLTINGNLGFGWGFDHLGADAARLNDTRIGTFSFHTTVVPVPAAAWLFISGLSGLLLSCRHKRKIAL